MDRELMAVKFVLKACSVADKIGLKYPTSEYREFVKENLEFGARHFNVSSSEIAFQCALFEFVVYN